MREGPHCNCHTGSLPGFRAQTSADDFAVIRSALSTAKKQGWNILTTLMQEPEKLVLSLRTV
jgi:transposase